MLSIKNLPNSERPYEKLEMYGEKSLSNSELLAIILKTGTKDQTAVALAQNVLALKGNQSLRSLQEISLNELKRIKGIGNVKAIQIKALCEIAKRMERPLNLNATIKGPQDVANLLMDELRYEKREVVKILILNTKNILQKMVEIGIGSISSNSFDMKQIFEEIIKIGMNKFILVHNHPSGDPTPSLKDIQLTEQIKSASELLQIEFMDHIVIGDGTFQSIFTNMLQKKKDSEVLKKGETKNEIVFNKK